MIQSIIRILRNLKLMKWMKMPWEVNLLTVSIGKIHGKSQYKLSILIYKSKIWSIMIYLIWLKMTLKLKIKYWYFTTMKVGEELSTPEDRGWSIDICICSLGSTFRSPWKVILFTTQKNHSQNDLIYKMTLNLAIYENDLKMKNQKLVLVSREGWWRTEYTNR